MNNILDYVKPLVDKIYRREPDYDNDIVVQPNEILIKQTGQFPRVYAITLTENGLFDIIISYDDGIMDFERETIEQVVDLVLE